jgi:hypothetical protein
MFQLRDLSCGNWRMIVRRIPFHGRWALFELLLGSAMPLIALSGGPIAGLKLRSTATFSDTARAMASMSPLWRFPPSALMLTAPFAGQ